MNLKINLLTLAICLSFIVTTFGQVKTWYRDRDCDLLGDPSSTLISTTMPVGYVLNNTDCDDTTFRGEIWQYVGDTSFSGRFAKPLSLQLDKLNNLYLLYADSAVSKMTVVKYDGIFSWIQVGNSIPTTTFANAAILKLDPSGVPYVALLQNGKLTVQKFDGSNWVLVGNQKAITLLPYSKPNFCISAAGTFFVAYQEPSKKSTVEKFDGTNWNIVGNKEFTATEVRCKIAADENDVPYVACDAYIACSLSVMKFTGSAWLPLGGVIHSPGIGNSIYGINITTDRNRTPIVSYIDGVSHQLFFVKKYESFNWVDFGKGMPYGIGGTSHDYDFTTMYINKNNIPYLMVTSGIGNLYKMCSDTTWVRIQPFLNFTQQTAVAIDSNGIPYVAYSDATKYKISVETATIPSLGNPVIYSIDAKGIIGIGENDTLKVNGYLNDAAEWIWYEGSCGGKKINAFWQTVVSPATTTTYYVRGEGTCINPPTPCNDITVYVYPAGISNTNFDSIVSVYPNPAINTLVVKAEKLSVVPYTIYDLMGRKAITGICSFTNHMSTIDIKDLIPGMYIIELNNKNGHSLKRQFAKQ